LKEKTIEKNLLPSFIETLLEDYDVFAPVEKDDLLKFERISKSSQISLDSQRLERSPKEVLFPQAETLFSYHQNSQGKIIEEPPPLERERILFFVRPCDAKALSLLDCVFSSWKPEDPYYMDKRRKTLVVGRACIHPWSTCFCTSVGVDPFGKEGIDLIFMDIGERYVVEPITERGERLIDENPLFNCADETDLKRLKEVSDRSANAIQFKVDVEGIEDRLKTIYDHPFWERISEKCIGCGICSYLCPVCHCFDILDEGTTMEGRRVRIWDACQYPLFTLHASGHNPRPSKKERIRQRVMHKFNYFIENFEEIGCVGCGRCVRECPVNLDIRNILEAIVSLEAN